MMLAAAVLACGTVQLRAANVTDSWLSAVSGSWGDATKWSLSTFPNNGGGTTYSVIIGATGSAYTVSENGVFTINDLSLTSANATLDMTSTLSVVNSSVNLAAGTITIDGGFFSGGSITQNGGTLKFTSSGGGFSNNASVVGDMNVNTANGIVGFLTGADFTGNATISGSNSLMVYEYNGTLGSGRSIDMTDPNAHFYVSHNNSAFTDSTFTIASGASIHGEGNINSGAFTGGSTNTILNNGLISADIASTTMLINPDVLTNHGTLQAINGSTLTISATNWTNSGTFVVNNSTINLNGTLTSGANGIGSFSRTGGTINLNGFINNTGHQIDMSASTGTILLTGGIVSGGSITQSGGGFGFTGSGGGFANNASLIGDVNVGTSGLVSFLTGADFTGNATLSGNNALMVYEYNGSLTAGRSIDITASGAQFYISHNNTAGTDSTFTISSTSSIHGRGNINSGAFTGGSTNTILNNGTITADIAGTTMLIEPDRLTNNGTLAAINGATLNIDATNWTNTGTLAENNSTLILTGTLTTGATGLGTFSRSGGTIEIVGFVNNAGNHIDLPAAAGSILLGGGTISGGTITQSGGAFEYTNSGGGFANNASVIGDLALSDPSAVLGFFTGGDFTGNATLSGSNTLMVYEYNGTLTAGRNIDLAGAGAQFEVSHNNTAGTDSTFTIASTSSIHGRGAISSGAFTGGSTNTIINNGTIASDIAGASLIVEPDRLINNGTLGAFNGSILNIDVGSWTNGGTFAVDTTSTINLNGTFNVGASGFGTVSRSGGTINLGGFINNTGHQINIPTADGVLRLNGGTISGGSITLSGGSIEFTATGGGFSNNASFIGDLSMVDSNAVLGFFTGGDFTGNATLSGSSSLMVYEYNGTLGAGRNIDLTTNTAQFEVSHNNTAGTDSTFTIAAGAQIHGRGVINSGAFTGGSTNTVINNGSIASDLTGGTMLVEPDRLTNNGTLAALNGSTLSISATNWTNTGTFLVDATSTINLNATLTIGAGGFGNVSRSGGTINLNGFINNAGNHIDLPTADGVLRLNGGTISGGSVTFSGGSIEFTSNGGGFGNNASVIGDLTIPDSNGELGFFTGGDFTGNATLSGANSLIVYEYSGTLGSGRNIDLADSNARFYVSHNNTAGTDSTFTIASGASIHGRGNINSGAFTGGSTNTIINNGLIAADVAAATLTVNPDRLTNNGTLAANAGTLSIATFTNNTGHLAASNGGKIITTFVNGNLNTLTDDGTNSLIRVTGNYTINQTLSVTNRATLDLLGTYTRSGSVDASGRIIFDYTGAANSPLSAIKTDVTSGYNHGAWNGPGIFSTAAQSQHNTAVGYAEASAVLSATGGVFSGENVDGTAVLVRWTYAGDANIDGKVDVTDLGNLASNWQKTGNWINGDFNYDGTINVTDLGMMASNWQQGVGNPLGPDSFQQALAQFGLGGALVPEPAGVMGIALGITALQRRRRRSRNV